MNVRRLLVALSTVAVTATTCSVAPAQADPDLPFSVMPTEHELDGGWARVVCTQRRVEAGTEVRCNVRVPGGFDAIRTTYMHGGDVLAHGTDYTYREDHRHDSGPRPDFTGQVTSDVRFTCGARGDRVACVAEFRERVSMFQVTPTSAGSRYGSTMWVVGASA